jgi:hypothetical protein
MSFVAFNGWAVWHAGTVRLPTARGRWAPGGGEAFSKQRLTTDSLGSMNLTLTNVVVGSAIRIEEQASGTVVYQGTAAASTVVVPIDYYAGGDAKNNLRIKVRKATSSPLYKAFATLATISDADQSVYIAQISDE